MCTSRSGEIFTPMISTHSSSTKQLLYQFQSVHKSRMGSALRSHEHSPFEHYGEAAPRLYRRADAPCSCCPRAKPRVLDLKQATPHLGKRTNNGVHNQNEIVPAANSES